MASGSAADRSNDIAQGLPKGEKLPLLPAAVKLMEYRRAARDRRSASVVHADGRAAIDAVSVPLRAEHHGTSASTHLFILHEGNIHSYRQIFMDGRKHPAELDPTWFGHSIGRWENKDTLVIDTVGFNDKFWFDRKGTPHSEQLHTIERWTRPNMGTLVNTVTIEDPGALLEAVHRDVHGAAAGAWRRDHGIHLPGEQSVRAGRRHDNPFFGK